MSEQVPEEEPKQALINPSTAEILRVLVQNLIVDRSVPASVSLEETGFGDLTSRRVVYTVHVPESQIKYVIGAGGKTLVHLRELVHIMERVATGRKATVSIFGDGRDSSHRIRRNTSTDSL